MVCSALDLQLFWEISVISLKMLCKAEGKREEEGVEENEALEKEEEEE